VDSSPWQLFAYRLSGSPSSARVAVWRELRRLGALPLQAGVVVVPELGELAARIDAVSARVLQQGGSVYRFRLDLDSVQRDQLEREWSALRQHEYAEIIEECDTKFVREIEFEIFRGNLTAGEAEEIEADLDKIRAWFDRVQARDWFGAPNIETAKVAIARCEALLDDFMERVYRVEANRGPVLETPADLPWGRAGTDPIESEKPGEFTDARRRGD
jgi:hypothetical protein